MSLRQLSRSPALIVTFPLVLLVWLLGGNADAETTIDHARQSYLENAEDVRRCFEVEAPCGWVELGTHDSLPAFEKPRGTSDLTANAATVATSGLCSKVGVAVQQIIEPFAMVGPYLGDSLDVVEQFSRWWEASSSHQSADSGKAKHTNPRLVPVVGPPLALDLIQIDFMKAMDRSNQRFDLCLLDDPLDPGRFGAGHFGASVLVSKLDRLPEPPSVKQEMPKREHVLVGCSPMIFTLEENYMAYDMAERDVKLWCVFPTTTRPFCIRRQPADFDSHPMWNDFDVAVERETKVAPESLASQFQCSAYCVLEDWVVTMENWTSAESHFRRSLRPRQVGRQIAAFFSQQMRVTGRAAAALSKHWPEVKPDQGPSPAGAALLARAGATEKPPAEELDSSPAPHSTLAQLPGQPGELRRE
jgi:hypothetical protein